MVLKTCPKGVWGLKTKQHVHHVGWEVSKVHPPSHMWQTGNMSHHDNLPHLRVIVCVCVCAACKKAYATPSAFQRNRCLGKQTRSILNRQTVGKQSEACPGTQVTGGGGGMTR